ncbi:hypothetical protein GBA52_000195 [Prunus armeniaca]|nr:hypothetical protein GBA52_000195 [Prunus armeniaca]
MGKGEQNLHQQQSHGGENSSELICPRCSMVFNRIAKDFSFRCVFVLILSLSIFLSGIFWILPYRSTKSGCMALAKAQTEVYHAQICSVRSFPLDLVEFRSIYEA